MRFRFFHRDSNVLCSLHEAITTMKSLSIAFSVLVSICFLWQLAALYRGSFLGSGSMTATATAWHPGTGGEARLTTLVVAPEGSLGVAHKSIYYDNLPPPRAQRNRRGGGRRDEQVRDEVETAALGLARSF